MGVAMQGVRNALFEKVPIEDSQLVNSTWRTVQER
jgi:hypothetical protein